MKLFKILVISFVMLLCVGQAVAEEEKPFTVSIINDTDVLMCQTTYWMNHDIPNCRGPFAICGSELKPGADHTFDFGIAASKARVFVTRWTICRSYDKDECKKYRNDLVSKIPTDTSMVKIYHKHSEMIAK